MGQTTFHMISPEFVFVQTDAKRHAATERVEVEFGLISVFSTSKAKGIYAVLLGPRKIGCKSSEGPRRILVE